MTAGSGPQPSYSFNTSNNQIVGFNYDAAGNETYDGAHTYTYDAEGNVTSVDGGSTAQYVYAALNHRVRSVVGSGATEFVFDQWSRRVSNWNGTTPSTSAELTQFYFDGHPIAYISGPPYLQYQNPLGTDLGVSDNAGDMVDEFTSLPFGDAVTGSTGSYGFQFATLDYDAETNTDHAQFRQYSDTQGRWLSPDPYSGSYDFTNPQSFNRYAYVMNNPRHPQRSERAGPRRRLPAMCRRSSIVFLLLRRHIRRRERPVCNSSAFAKRQSLG